MDITERKRAEEALKEIHDELEEKVKERTAQLTKANEELAIFRRFAEASGEGFGMADFDGRIAYVNPAMCRLFAEEKPEDVIGKSVFMYYPNEYVQRRKNELIPALLQRDGTRFHGDPAPSARMPATSAQLALVRDITERKAAEESLRKNHDHLQTIYDGIIEGLVVRDFERSCPASELLAVPNARLYGRRVVRERAQRHSPA